MLLWCQSQHLSAFLRQLFPSVLSFYLLSTLNDLFYFPEKLNCKPLIPGLQIYLDNFLDKFKKLPGI